MHIWVVVDHCFGYACRLANVIGYASFTIVYLVIVMFGLVIGLAIACWISIARRCSCIVVHAVCHGIAVCIQIV